jgi:signal transduction histidine kinase
VLAIVIARVLSAERDRLEAEGRLHASELREAGRRETLRRVVDAQEHERRRIARELHDDISQRLALLTVGIDQLTYGQPGPHAELFEKLNNLSRESKEIATHVHALSYDLHSPRLEFLDLATIARGYCRETTAKQDIEIEFSVHGVLPATSYDISLCLFRILQEALHNAVKHSGVRQFVVQLSAMPGEIALRVSDAGVGFDLEDKRRSRGLGLVSMRERIRMVGGVISIESKPGGGTTVFARVPLGLPSS